MGRASPVGLRYVGHASDRGMLLYPMDVEGACIIMNMILRRTRRWHLGNLPVSPTRLASSLPRVVER